MSAAQDEVRAIVRRDGVIARAAHPDLTTAIARLLRDKELVAVLPGVYTTAAASHERLARVLALASRQPDAVLVGRTAAQLTYWPGLRGEVVSFALPHKCRTRPGYLVSRRTIAPELVVTHGPLRLTVPALTALDLCEELEGDSIDTALRTRAATLRGLHRALELSPGRPGNRDRRALLLDSRNEPWSAAERLCHRLLRGAGITGWRANLAVTAQGRRYFLDVAFAQLRIAVEIDGRLHEDRPDVFESDRQRQNALVLDGWLVLRFTWRMLTEQPALVLRCIEEALASRRAHF